MTHSISVPRSDRVPPPGKAQLPRGVWSMAFTELWERYSFYGLQGILSFYLLYSLAQGGLEIAPAAAAGIVGAYGGAVYLAQVIGAWFGDRLVAPKHMVLFGAFVILGGHLLLSVTQGLSGLGIGLVLIVIGTGALKTNITSIVGFLVEDRDQQERDVSFSYFYMAINIGAVLGPLTTGFVQNQFGFHWGFGLAAVGMAGALVQYLLSMKKLPQRASEINNPLPRNKYPMMIGIALAGVAVILIAIYAGLLRAENLSSTTTIIALLAAAAYFVTMAVSKSVTSDDRKRVLGFLPLFLFSGIYFGLLFQKFTAISILITERINLQIGDWTFPVAWITTVSPLAAVLITPLIAKLWRTLGSRQPSPGTKFGIGLVQIGCAYLFLLIISTVTGDAYIPLFLILLFMMMAGSSEVFVGPIGLSVATKIGPKAFKSQMVGLNFLTLALGSSLSGLLGQLFAAIESTNYFMIVSGTGLALGLTLILARKPLGRLLSAGQ
ncbi:peptide MFS transporter [Leucobacter sp. G161]|uniref:peptide MFS transporter n=1 Tax=Leucobacter sp. G161 TaxID=663704 RepID=UPI0009FAE142|nr:oligopeptide:H+ symporter [Leucobacter sp. G161]